MQFIKHNDDLIYKKGAPIGDSNVWFLDYDGTIIQQKNGNCPNIRKKNDWRFLYPEVKAKLEQFTGVIVIISNQKNLEKNETKKAGFIEQITEVFRILQLRQSPWILVAIGGDLVYRKPSTGAIDFLADKSGFNPLEGDYFYVGDACGRESDHSACDYRLAENLGWRFQTPEMFFLNQANNIPPQVDLIGMKKEVMIVPTIPENINILFLQAPPASGKTTICKKFPQFYRINQDELKTLSKCLKVAKEKLASGQKIIVDRTNPNVESMAPFMELDANCGVLSIRIDKWMNKHLNYFREWKDDIKRIPEIAYNIYWKKYEKPKMEDGFKWVGEVEWKMEEEYDTFKRWYF